MGKIPAWRQEPPSQDWSPGWLRQLPDNRFPESSAASPCLSSSQRSRRVNSESALRMSDWTSCAAWRKHSPPPAFRPVCIGLGHEVSWPVTEKSYKSEFADVDFVLSSCTVDVSDANVCHRVPICRWHACLEPPVFVTFVLLSDLKSSAIVLLQPGYYALLQRWIYLNRVQIDKSVIYEDVPFTVFNNKSWRNDRKRCLEGHHISQSFFCAELCSTECVSGDVLLLTLVSALLFTVFRWGDPSIFKYPGIVITRSWHNAKAVTNRSCSSSIPDVLSLGTKEQK